MIDIKLRIKKIIKEKLNFGDIEIKDDVHLKETLSIDSIDFLSLVIGIEKEFNIEITDLEITITSFFSLNTLEKFIQSKGGT